MNLEIITLNEDREIKKKAFENRKLIKRCGIYMYTHTHTHTHTHNGLLLSHKKEFNKCHLQQHGQT